MLLSPQGSLIPTVVALSQFFIARFPYMSWYPFWYLGNPYRYLIGPVVPVVLMGLSRVFQASLYHLYIGVIVFSWLMGAVGVYLLISNTKYSLSAKATEDKQNSKFNYATSTGIFGGVLYLVLPFSWVGLYFQNGLKVVAMGVIPLVFLIYQIWVRSYGKIQSSEIPPFPQGDLPLRGARQLRWTSKVQNGNSKIKNCIVLVLLVVLIAICLLVSVSSLLAIIIGMIGIFLATSHGIEYGKLVREEVIGKSFLILWISICLATVWYTPAFWWVMLANPSFGGVALWHVVINLFQMVLQFLPLVLAVLLVRWRHVRVRGIVLFGSLFLVSFLALSVVRFLANPRFVIDWIGFLPEIQLGTALVLATNSKFKISPFARATEDKQSSKFLSRRFMPKVIILLLVVVVLGTLLFISGKLLFILFYYSNNEFQSRITGIIRSQYMRDNERIFLSGSSVFWIDAALSVAQVRGGNDGGAIHTSWADGAYQIREGAVPSLAREWLQIFGASYILVHQSNSEEMYHDFKHTGRFAELPLLQSLRGDSLYKVPDATLGRVAREELLLVDKPANGADGRALYKYVNSLVHPAIISFKRSDLLRVAADIRKGEVISLAVAYDPGWKLQQGEGMIRGDALGNMVIVPGEYGKEQWVLRYEIGWSSYIGPVLLGIVGIVIFIWYDWFSPRVKRRVPKVHLGLKEEEDY